MANNQYKANPKKLTTEHLRFKDLVINTKNWNTTKKDYLNIKLIR